MNYHHQEFTVGDKVARGGTRRIQSRAFAAARSEAIRDRCKTKVTVRIGTELSAFHLLEHPLGQPVSVDSGMFWQDAALGVVREFQFRVASGDHQALRSLWETRRILPILWDRRDVRITHWPAAQRGALVWNGKKKYVSSHKHYRLSIYSGADAIATTERVE